MSHFAQLAVHEPLISRTDFNPRSLVEIRDIEKASGRERQHVPDAIFVPYSKRTAYVAALLSELRWYPGQIYLMHSDENDIGPIADLLSSRTIALDYRDQSFLSSYTSLRTYRHCQIAPASFDSSWDLPLKRSYALLFALKKQYCTILFVDDDIRGLSRNAVCSACGWLESYKLVGSFVSEFPDHSVVEHLARATGFPTFPFMSGSYLYCKLSQKLAFFPPVYNEDWLFMLPYIREQSVCSVGDIQQLRYDPFDSIDRIVFQEFGDVIAEGLYTLMHDEALELRLNPKIWKDVLAQRKERYEQLLSYKELTSQRHLLLSGMTRLEEIAPGDCVSFVEAWEADLLTWQEIIQEAR